MHINIQKTKYKRIFILETCKTCEGAPISITFSSDSLDSTSCRMSESYNAESFSSNYISIKSHIMTKINYINNKCNRNLHKNKYNKTLQTLFSAEALFSVVNMLAFSETLPSLALSLISVATLTFTSFSI